MGTVYNNLLDINGETAGDESGRSVSLNSDGTIVAIGAPANDGSGTDAGHVRVYQYADSVWTQLGNDIDGEASGDESGRSVSLNSDGTIVAIGARLNDGTGDNAGHVRVYQYVNSVWTQLGADIDGEAAGDRFGYSVSLNSAGTIVAIGAPLNDGTGTDAGHTRIYQYTNDTWTQVGNDIDGEAAGDWSGYSVSLNSDGTIVAIGAIHNDGTGTSAGQTRIYQYANSVWTQVGSDIDGEAASDQSGYSVSLNSDGTIVAIGAIYNDGTGNDVGHTRVYQYANSVWTQVGTDINGEAADDHSGYSVSLNSDGTVVAIGARYNDPPSKSNAGHVRVYQYVDSAWTQVGSDIDGEAANDWSGWSVSLNSDGTIVAIGAIYNDGSGTDAGHTRIFQLIDGQWNQNVVVAPTCFVGETIIHMEKGEYKRIDELERGDMVLIDRDSGKCLPVARITSCLIRRLVHIPKGVLNNDEDMYCTGKHKVAVRKDKMVDACRVPGASVVSRKPTRVYNIQFEVSSQFYVTRSGVRVESESPTNRSHFLPKYLYFSPELYVPPATISS